MVFSQINSDQNCVYKLEEFIKQLLSREIVFFFYQYICKVITVSIVQLQKTRLQNQNSVRKPKGRKVLGDNEK